MNLKEIEYILKIDEERNVTRAAEKLYLTHSALNQQLLRLEQEIGSPLFNRVRSGWTRTPAEDIYMDGARELMRIKKGSYLSEPMKDFISLATRYWNTAL